MKPKEYLSLIQSITADPKGFVPLPIFRKVIRTTPRASARDEAILASVLEQANPRHNITSSYGIGPEQQMVDQQLWVKGTAAIHVKQWRDVPVKGDEKLYSYDAGIPVPNSIAEPGVEKMDLGQKVREMVDVPICPICEISADLCDCQEQDPE